MKSISRQHIAQTYDTYAPLYDHVFGAVLEPGRRALARAAHARSPASILEIGIGTGLTLPRYPASAAFVGIDLSFDMLERARRRAALLPGRRITLQVMDAERMGFPDHSFDCVALPYVLSVTPDPARLVAETRRVCKKGGTILVLNHFSGSRFWWLMERALRSLADRIGFRSDFSFEQQILAHDWQVESVTPVNLLGLSRLVVIRNT